VDQKYDASHGYSQTCICIVKTTLTLLKCGHEWPTHSKYTVDYNCKRDGVNKIVEKSLGKCFCHQLLWVSRESVNEIITRIFEEVPSDCCFTCKLTGITPFVWDLILKVHLTVRGYAQGKLNLSVVLSGILCF